jgi:peptidoglycan/LPS O-acetylase OafA/YrhL
LDGLRGLAILVVVCYHYISMPGEGGRGVFGALAWCCRLGWAGVDLFFVLSGFLIGGILIDARESPRYFRTFYMRRAFRILPLYAILLAVFWAGRAVGDLRASSLFSPALPAWSYGTFTQNIAMVLNAGTAPGFHFFQFGAALLAGTWSLAIEEQFYLLLPLVVRHVPVARLSHVAVGMITLAPVIRAMAIALFRQKAAIATYVLMPCRMDALGFGLLAALLIRQGPLAAGLLRRTILAGLCGLAVFQWIFSHFSPLTMVVGYSATAVAGFAALLACLASQDSLWSRIMMWKALRFLGDISYCVYLIHGTILVILYRAILKSSPALNGPASVWTGMIAFAVCIGLATVSMRFMESKLMRLGRRFHY